ncbi:MAG: acyl-CoA/acyl-ACP dehydrogenase [Gammaproteobacteria bacterium]|mgnify:FL=1|nr:acyl-CoA/acyl-ACP dehydrogenase [Gammaproteobacteria bacterium]
MSYQLKPKTPAGKIFVNATESLTESLRDRAQAADQSSTVAATSFDDLKTAGINGAFVPEDCGGFGLRSIHDWIVGMSRLGRGDGSVALATNMHLAVSRGLSSGRAAAQSSGNDTLAKALEAQLEQIVTGNMTICATATEPGTDNLHPLTQATPVNDGWRIDGLKLFVTGSPIASHIAMNLRVKGRDEKPDSISSVMMPMTTKGIEPQNDWNAMGMKGSGSQSIRFNNVVVPKTAVNPIGPWGYWNTGMLMNRNLANLPLLGVFLGIAEHAYELAIEAALVTKKEGKPRQADLPGIQHMIAEIEITLASTQSIVGRMGEITDDFLEEFQQKKIPIERAHELLKDHQSMKWVVNRNAIEIVNRAMDIVGGSGFMDNNPLSRLYRDVRAGPFMQPYSPTEARDYIGKVALGIYPSK